MAKRRSAVDNPIKTHSKKTKKRLAINKARKQAILSKKKHR